MWSQEIKDLYDICTELSESLDRLGPKSSTTYSLTTQLHRLSNACVREAESHPQWERDSERWAHLSIASKKFVEVLTLEEDEFPMGDPQSAKTKYLEKLNSAKTYMDNVYQRFQ